MVMRDGDSALLFKILEAIGISHGETLHFSTLLIGNNVFYRLFIWPYQVAGNRGWGWGADCDSIPFTGSMSVPFGYTNREMAAFSVAKPYRWLR